MMAENSKLTERRGYHPQVLSDCSTTRLAQAGLRPA